MANGIQCRQAKCVTPGTVLNKADHFGLAGAGEGGCVRTHRILIAPPGYGPG